MELDPSKIDITKKLYWPEDILNLDLGLSQLVELGVVKRVAEEKVPLNNSGQVEIYGVYKFNAENQRELEIQCFTFNAGQRLAKQMIVKNYFS